MTQPTEYENVSYNAPDGSQWGKASTDKIAWFGGTPSSQSATSSGVHVTTFGAAIPAQTASASGFGASTAAIMTSTFTAVAALQVDMAEAQRVLNNMRAILVRHNLMLGA